MKIAMMTNNYKPFVAGVPISIERLTISLRMLGHQVVVFAPTYKDQKEEEDIVRYRSLLQGVACGFSVPNCIDPVIERRFKEGDFDVIHVHHPMMMGRTAAYLSDKYEVPLVFTYHTRYEQYMHYVGLSALKGILPAYIKNYSKHCDGLIAPTPMMKQYLEKIRVNAPVYVLPTGLESHCFQPEDRRVQEIRSTLLKDRKYLFCTVARLAKEKNLPFLFRSLKLVKESMEVKGKKPDFRLAVIGKGPEEKQLRELSGRLGMDEEIVFVGEVPNKEVKNYCAASDLFLFASQSETQGIVLIEAMAVGTPVLALKGTGTEDIVFSGKNGYMVDSLEWEFAAKLMDILDKKEIEILQKGALETAESYRCDIIAKEAVQIYRKAMWLHQEKPTIEMYMRENSNGTIQNFNCRG